MTKEEAIKYGIKPDKLFIIKEPTITYKGKEYSTYNNHVGELLIKSINNSPYGYFIYENSAIGIRVVELNDKFDLPIKVSFLDKFKEFYNKFYEL